MQARNWKWHCHIKLWIAIKELSVSRAFNIIFVLVYCGLYTMTIDVVTWRIIKKWCIWSLHLRNFLWLSVFALFLQKIRGSSRNFFNFIYIYKIEIRNSKTYLHEVSVSSTMFSYLIMLVDSRLSTVSIWKPCWKINSFLSEILVCWSCTEKITIK